MRLLLDAHLSPVIAQRLMAQGTDAVSVRDWQSGIYLEAVDDRILTAALAEQRVLVTFDARTIPSALKERAETGRHHAGVVVVDDRTIRQNDRGGLIVALAALARDAGDQDWHNRLDWLAPAPLG